MIITSWDDGSEYDRRMADLLERYEIPAIFYIPNNCQLTVEDIEDLSERSFEIGGHTVSHYPDLKLLDDRTLEVEIKENKRWLEEIIGKKIKSFCYPRGRFDERVKKAVKKVGYKEARTVRVFNTGEPIDPFETDTTLHITYPRKEYDGRDVFKLARWYVSGYKLGYFKKIHFWGHSKEVNDRSEWNEVESLFKYIKEKGIK